MDEIIIDRQSTVGETLGVEFAVVDEVATEAVRLAAGVERKDRRFEVSFAS
jgi:hypothetical protein